ncbi:MAG TPA: sialate O-acetylesterase, partial [Tepidisphaeraceae bacterium]|jgi:sialate O-acetylesterase|nr:sialate O-acetylesterase [Tepidisphaeraceae bacterium]
MRLLVLLVTSSITLFVQAKVKLPAIIADHMVVQRGQKIPIWGWADAGEKVTVKTAGQEQSATADEQGNWRVTFNPIDAVGAIEISVQGKNAIKVSDVLVGDVWVCSGQSNMEMRTRAAMNGDQEVASANDSRIRLFHVQGAAFEKPQKDVKGKWELCTPDSVATFSAVGYFFGRDLRKKLNVPIGLIESDWGGTPAESWTDHKTLTSDPAFSEIIQQHEQDLAKYPAARKKFDQSLHEWKDKVETKDPGNKKFDEGWAKLDFDDSNWKTMPVPSVWEKSLKLNIDGAVWFRRSVDVPADWTGKELELSLGQIDDADAAYFNGEQIGDTGGDLAIFVHRKYRVPGNLVKAGKNEIAVRVFDHRGDGGFIGTPGELALAPSDGDSSKPSSTKSIPLAGDWRYAVEYSAEPKPNVPGPREPRHGDWAWAPSNLYNGMIHPIVPFAIKGAIWYQGESNAERHGAYEHLLSSMITGWRRQWGQGDFPFLIVQLANFMAPATRPVQQNSNWAPLREAQARTAAHVPNVGLATAVDIGDAVNIHPKNKQEVGRRLALAAMKIAYGESLVFSGPTYKSMAVEGNKIVLTFDNVGGGLKTKGDALKGFAIAGKDKQWHYADATIDGAAVIVSSKDVAEPVAVRYSWADNPNGNLYNKDELPAIPFRTDR